MREIRATAEHCLAPMLAANRRENAPRGVGDEARFTAVLTLKFVSRAPVLARERRVSWCPAPRAEGHRRRKTRRRWVPFRVPLFVLIAQRRRGLRFPPAGTPRFAPLVLDGAPSSACRPYELIRVLRLDMKKRLRDWAIEDRAVFFGMDF
jgi:hypothetical protein